VHFFCSPKHNGNSGFAVNGDGLCYARELLWSVRWKLISRIRTGVLTIGTSSMTVDGESMCNAFKCYGDPLYSRSKRSVRQSVSGDVRTCHFIRFFEGDTFTIITRGQKQAQNPKEIYTSLDLPCQVKQKFKPRSPCLRDN
jgi:hypothetical protein